MDASQSSQTSLPGARVADVSHSGPLPLYDLHLRTLNDSYIAFFNERCVCFHIPLARTLVGCVLKVRAYMQIKNRRDIVSIHTKPSAHTRSRSQHVSPPTVAIVSSSSTRSSAPSIISSTRNSQKLERFERPGSTFWTALREVRVSFMLGPRQAGSAETQLSRLSKSLLLSLVTATSVAYGGIGYTTVVAYLPSERYRSLPTHCPILGAISWWSLCILGNWRHDRLQALAAHLLVLFIVARTLTPLQRPK
jgi:hypothetical protein